MEGGYNFRDLGGYKNRRGEQVRWNTIFRSDDLATLTDLDLDYLAGIPLISIVDFRGVDEIKEAPDRIPESVKNVYSYSIMPGNMNSEQIKKLSKNIPVDQLMKKMYVLLVTQPEIVDQYRRFFALMQDNFTAPLLFHCSAGKDRTGMAAALFLSALDIDEEAVIQDYLLSNRYIPAKYAQVIAQQPQYKIAFEVDRSFIETAFSQIRKDYGSVNNYLETVLNVDLEKLRSLYLE